MCAYKLIISLREHQVANLRSCVDGTNGLQVQGVPEADMLVCGAATCCEEASV